MRYASLNGKILQNCFVSPVPCEYKYKHSTNKKIDVMVAGTDFEKGYSEKIDTVDYPITPEYVQSFGDEPSLVTEKRVNLGDVRDMQNILNNNDTIELRAKIEEMNKKIAELQSSTLNKKDSEVKLNESKIQTDVG